MSMTEQFPAENWLPVVGFPLYQVSDLGRVRRAPGARRKGARPGRVLSPALDRSRAKGYWGVQLYGDIPQTPVFRHMHVLVAAAFLGERPSGHEIAHLNDDPGDNRLSNLAYALPRDNRRSGRRPGEGLKGERNPAHKLTEADVTALRADCQHGDAARVAAKHGVSVATVYGARRGDAWGHLDAPPVRRAHRAPGKLTAQQAAEIRASYVGGSSHAPGNGRQLALEYCVSVSLIRAVAHGRVWKDLPENESS
jgi:hypothetical protein